LQVHDVSPRSTGFPVSCCICSLTFDTLSSANAPFSSSIGQRERVVSVVRHPLDPVQLMFLLVEYPFAPGKFVFLLGHELLLRYCEVCAAEFAPIVDDMLALELYEPHKSRMRAVHGCWKWAHTITSDRPQITFLTCGLVAEQSQSRMKQTLLEPPSRGRKPDTCRIPCWGVVCTSRSVSASDAYSSVGQRHGDASSLVEKNAKRT